jgi:hypothetical protein
MKDFTCSEDEEISEVVFSYSVMAKEER